MNLLLAPIWNTPTARAELVSFFIYKNMSEAHNKALESKKLNVKHGKPMGFSSSWKVLQGEAKDKHGRIAKYFKGQDRSKRPRINIDDIPL